MCRSRCSCSGCQHRLVQPVPRPAPCSRPDVKRAPPRGPFGGAGLFHRFRRKRPNCCTGARGEHPIVLITRQSKHMPGKPLEYRCSSLHEGAGNCSQDMPLTESAAPQTHVGVQGSPRLCTGTPSCTNSPSCMNGELQHSRPSAVKHAWPTASLQQAPGWADTHQLLFLRLLQRCRFAAQHGMRTAHARGDTSEPLSSAPALHLQRQPDKAHVSWWSDASASIASQRHQPTST